MGIKNKNSKGFTLVEIIIAVAILSFLIAIAVPDFIYLKNKTDLDNSVQEFVSALKLAQSKAISSENHNPYGIYLNTSVFPNQYVLFQGSSYGSKVAGDITYTLSDTMEFYNITGGNEIVFDILTGASDELKNVSIRNKDNPSLNKTVYVLYSGSVSFDQSSGSLGAGRVADSRHVQFAYSRAIDTATENIILTFNGSDETVVPISLYLKAGQIDWNGVIDVGGTIQTLEINTHRLNSPDTLFSIRRDRRYNNQSLDITISGDNTGAIAHYSADGSVTNYGSIYVSGFARQ